MSSLVASPRPRLTPLRATVILAAATAVALCVEVGVRHAVEDKLAAGASCQLRDAEANVSGFVTSNLASGDLGDVALEGQVVGSEGVPASAEVRLDGVRVGSFGTGARSADGGSAQMTIEWSDLPAEMLGESRGPMGGEMRMGAEDGELAMEGPQFTMLAAVELVDGGVQVTPRTLRAGEQEIPVERILPMVEQRAPQMAVQLRPRLMPLADLPSGATLTGVEVSDTGLVLDADLDPDELLGASSTCV